MVNQIIQKYVDIFESFVKNNFILEKNYYIYNMDVYKKLLFDGEIQQFVVKLNDYYYKNKYYYLERNPITFNEFNTIIRQILKKNNIMMEKKIKYNISKYELDYHIFIMNTVE